jgi:hypothetical protein
VDTSPYPAVRGPDDVSGRVVAFAAVTGG